MVPQFADAPGSGKSKYTKAPVQTSCWHVILLRHPQCHHPRSEMKNGCAPHAEPHDQSTSRLQPRPRSTSAAKTERLIARPRQRRQMRPRRPRPAKPPLRRKPLRLRRKPSLRLHRTNRRVPARKLQHAKARLVFHRAFSLPREIPPLRLLNQAMMSPQGEKPERSAHGPIHAAELPATRVRPASAHMCCAIVAAINRPWRRLYSLSAFMAPALARPLNFLPRVRQPLTGDDFIEAAITTRRYRLHSDSRSHTGGRCRLLVTQACPSISRC